MRRGTPVQGHGAERGLPPALLRGQRRLPPHAGHQPLGDQRLLRALRDPHQVQHGRAA